jgi:hypothetical protein
VHINKIREQAGLGPVFRIDHSELVQVVAEPANEILNGNVQIPETAPILHLYPVPDGRAEPFRVILN